RRAITNSIASGRSIRHLPKPDQERSGCATRYSCPPLTRPQWRASRLASPQTINSQRAPDPIHRTGKPFSVPPPEEALLVPLDASASCFVPLSDVGLQFTR